MDKVASRSISVWYVLMDFTASRFLGVEVREMRAQGAEVKVVAFRPSRPNAIARCKSDWGLASLSIETPRWREYLAQAFLVLRFPFLTAYLIAISIKGLRPLALR